ncbi:hypothetical protein AAVH_43003, partial [Aphelenchoides avenae]
MPKEPLGRNAESGDVARKLVSSFQKRAMGNWATPEPNPAVQRAELKAKAATDATDERPRRHPRMSLLPGDKPAMIAVNTKKKKASYIPPLVSETRAMTRAEITVMMRKKGLNAISVNLISPEASRMLKKPSKKDVKKGSCQCIDACEDCTCIK